MSLAVKQEIIAGYECKVRQLSSGALEIYVRPQTDVKSFDVAFAVFCEVSSRDGHSNIFMNITVEVSRNRSIVYEYEARHGWLARKTNASNRKWYEANGTSITNDQMNLISLAWAERRRRIENEKRESTKQNKERSLSEWRNSLAKTIDGLDKFQLISAIMGIAAEVEEPSHFKWLEDHLGISQAMAKRRG